MRLEVFGGEDTPGTLGLALADLDRGGRMDGVQGQVEHKTATDRTGVLRPGLAVDSAPPSVTTVGAREAGPGRRVVHARARSEFPSICTSSS